MYMLAGIVGNEYGETFSSPSPFTIAGIKFPHTRLLIDEFPMDLRKTGPYCHPCQGYAATSGTEGTVDD
jgi:hypothetical protein